MTTTQWRRWWCRRPGSVDGVSRRLSCLGLGRSTSRYHRLGVIISGYRQGEEQEQKQAQATVSPPTLALALALHLIHLIHLIHVLLLPLLLLALLLLLLPLFLLIIILILSPYLFTEVESKREEG